VHDVAAIEVEVADAAFAYHLDGEVRSGQTLHLHQIPQARPPQLRREPPGRNRGRRAA